MQQDPEHQGRHRQSHECHHSEQSQPSGPGCALLSAQRPTHSLCASDLLAATLLCDHGREV
jgi:hypothetical protein